MSQYTLITGASSGIGESLAREYAESGHDLILTARRTDLLEKLAAELREQHGRTVEVVSADLGDPGGVAELADTVISREWGLQGLVNNAGFGDSGPFAKRPREKQLAMIQVNVTALVDLTHRLLPLLQKAKAPFILNVASVAAFQAGPNMGVYYASKAFVLSFSESLAEELRGRVSVSALCPGPTESEFAERAEASKAKLFKMGTMSSQQVAEIGVKNQNRTIVIPGMRNKMMVWSGKITPRALLRRVAYRINR
ncbi:SDR family oxidoreductase [Salinisphaera sp.]|uniref:SDR family NAD(P)-dependent oxidoreductase n=1 Tax=Salinisphaera sp. TaxID=1914330 RepID=UPI000C4D5E24|nr:SDR family oxidoreductase [Salinisphaera sp.]MBS62823.1 short-chain dehydrogenase [Salinisphaera sp.]